MKYCTKCGYKLIDEAKFCNACGAAVEAAPAIKTESENPYAAEAPIIAVQEPVNTYTEAPKAGEELRAEEQALLDSFSIGLKHERLAWKIFSIVWTIFSAFFIFFGLIFALVAGITVAADDMEFAVFIPMAIMYITYGLIFMPVAIINLSMKKKLEGYRAKLYSDCKDGIGHFSVGSIVFCAFFNGVALIFNIVYFVKAKNNKAVIERIKANQDSYNSQK